MKDGRSVSHRIVLDVSLLFLFVLMFDSHVTVNSTHNASTCAYKLCFAAVPPSA